MPAAIQNHKGKSLFASFREAAWHRLGTVFTREITDFREMLAEAGIDYTVGFESLSTESGIILDRHRATVKTFPDGSKDYSGVVGNRYEIVQNEDKFSWLQSLSDGARWETAGELQDGTVFGSIAFEREAVLDPSGVADTVKTYALISGRHDGGSGIVAGLTPVRVVCRNTLNVALPGLQWRMGFRHTASVHERMAREAEFFRQAHTYFDAFEMEAKALYEKSVSDKQYANVVTKVIGKEPEDNTKGRQTKYEGKRELFMEAWNGAPNAGIKGTAWGVFNALTEANQWGRNIQDTDNGTENFFAAGSGFDIPTNTFRQNALALAKAIR